MTPSQALLFTLIHTHCPVSDLMNVVHEAQLLLNKDPEEIKIDHLYQFVMQLDQQLQPQLRCEERLCSTPEDRVEVVMAVVGSQGEVQPKSWCAACRRRNATLIVEGVVR